MHRPADQQDEEVHNNRRRLIPPKPAAEQGDIQAVQLLLLRDQAGRTGESRALQGRPSQLFIIQNRRVAEVA